MFWWSCAFCSRVSPCDTPGQRPVLVSYSFFSTPGPGGSRWRDYGALAIIMAGIAFGFHQLYKVSCLPGATVLCHPWHSAFLTLQRHCTQWAPGPEHRGCGGGREHSRRDMNAHSTAASPLHLDSTCSTTQFWLKYLE